MFSTTNKQQYDELCLRGTQSNVYVIFSQHSFNKLTFIIQQYELKSPTKAHLHETSEFLRKAETWAKTRLLSSRNELACFKGTIKSLILKGHFWLFNFSNERKPQSALVVSECKLLARKQQMEGKQADLRRAETLKWDCKCRGRLQGNAKKDLPSLMLRADATRSEPQAVSVMDPLTVWLWWFMCIKMSFGELE